MDFEGALVVDEVNHILESLGVGFVEQEPLVLKIAQSGAEVWAGNGKEKTVTPKLLPEKYLRTSYVAKGPIICLQTSCTSESSRMRQRSEQGSPGQGGRSRGRLEPSHSSPHSDSSLEVVKISWIKRCKRSQQNFSNMHTGTTVTICLCLY